MKTETIVRLITKVNKIESKTIIKIINKEYSCRIILNGKDYYCICMYIVSIADLLWYRNNFLSSFSTVTIDIFFMLSHFCSFCIFFQFFMALEFFF